MGMLFYEVLRVSKLQEGSQPSTMAYQSRLTVMLELILGDYAWVVGSYQVVEGSYFPFILARAAFWRRKLVEEAVKNSLGGEVGGIRPSMNTYPRQFSHHNHYI